MATKAEIEAAFGGRKPIAVIDLDFQVAGVKQAIVMQPNGRDFLKFLRYEADAYEQPLKVFPDIVGPAKGEKLTGAKFTGDDIGAMSGDDVGEINSIVADEFSDLRETYTPSGDVYELLHPIDLGGGEMLRSLRFEPRSFAQAKSLHQATTVDEHVVRFIECMATCVEDPDLPLSDTLIEQLHPADIIRIMQGFLFSATADNARKSRRLSARS